MEDVQERDIGKMKSNMGPKNFQLMRPAEISM